MEDAAEASQDSRRWKGSHRHLQNSVDKLWWEEAHGVRRLGTGAPRVAWGPAASFPGTDPGETVSHTQKPAAASEDVAQLPKAPFGAPTLCSKPPAPRSSPPLPSSAPSPLHLVSEAWGWPVEAVHPSSAVSGVPQVGTQARGSRSTARAVSGGCHSVLLGAGLEGQCPCWDGLCSSFP